MVARAADAGAIPAAHQAARATLVTTEDNGCRTLLRIVRNEFSFRTDMSLTVLINGCAARNDSKSIEIRPTTPR